ncbi:uncharacterized protein A4U43_C10F11430 [Asparagus officinalis]|uniref:Pentacotripeptide-repeat region of PRORP domain-containing protein n=1 Tax=Asparagus officinalis TaxID=4686 RepID=A0A5P1E2J3_ASPOF|nr:pentatricopeptide repeat-containing protein At1g12300, mitochondrial-like [Asparagus officinalis]XP_020247199.1 pentatricopeptide repeat-containing protein At1g12300, mitochondrial-like [Asparagus officinalis]XP_020247200.1 pentatricopeptide repeat-containing protein At1g12300, mitochondrial-like [Asparagus officinalis]XP_020247201.1 pentatricopeptide repeat-containing protein At1g12300, mitochondrial-like [Asparagus officinalis]XP_020247202.1 pentatricopeptide repeat-containing protein At1g
MPYPRARHLRKTLANVSTDDLLSNLLSAAPRRPPPPGTGIPKTRRTLYHRRISGDSPLDLADSEALTLSSAASFFNPFINALVAAKCRPEAQQAMSILKRSDFIPFTNQSYSILLKIQFLLANDNHSMSPYAVIGAMVKLGCFLDEITYLTLISGLCWAGRIKEALGIVDRMFEENCPPTVRCFTSIVRGYCIHGRVDEAKDLVDRMRLSGCSPDAVTYTILIGALCERGEFDEVGRMLGESELKGWSPDEVTYNVYMSALCKAGEADKAFRLLSVMRRRGLCETMETLHILFDCSCRNLRYKSLQKAEDILHWDVDVFFYNTLMSRLCQIGQWRAVNELLASMLKRGIETLHTFTIVIHSLCRKRSLGKAKFVFYSMGFQADVVAFNTLLLGFKAASEFGEVHQLFLDMGRGNVTPNEFTYSIMIDSLCREHKYLEAVNCFLESIRNNLHPNLIVRPIRWLVKDDKRREILRLFEEILRRGFVLDGFMFDSLIRGFCNKGFCQSVESDIFYLIFDRMLGVR